jgi:hypothetical protein
MQRRRFKNSTKPSLAHSTRACQYMKYIVNILNIFIVSHMRLYVPPEEHLLQVHTNCLIFSVPNKILFVFIFSDFCLSNFSHHL